MLTMYGIPNCDTVKKARAALEAGGVAYRFHDYKKQGVPETELREWIAEFGPERILNRSGMTWRKLSEEERASATSAEGALALAMDKPSVIRRPVLTGAGRPIPGFDEDAYGALAKNR